MNGTWKLIFPNDENALRPGTGQFLGLGRRTKNERKLIPRQKMNGTWKLVSPNDEKALGPGTGQFLGLGVV